MVCTLDALVWLLMALHIKGCSVEQPHVVYCRQLAGQRMTHRSMQNRSCCVMYCCMQARVVTLSNSFQQSNLQTLTSLSKLQALTFTMSGAYRDYPSYSGLDNAALQLAVQQFPGRLPSLTKLELPLGVLKDISSVSQCTRLRDLQLQHTRAHDGWRCLCAAEWASLAHLTCLTCLHVGLDIDCDDDAAAFYSVLGKLKKLQVVGAYKWGPSSLPALQSLRLYICHASDSRDKYCWWMECERVTQFQRAGMLTRQGAES